VIWVVISVLGLAAGAAVAWRLGRESAPETAKESLTAADYDLEVYRDQLRELDHDVDRGVVDTADAEAARNEIRQRALTAEQSKPADDAVRRPLSRVTIALIAASVPVFSVALYAILGRPELADQRNLTVQQQRRGPSAADMKAAASLTPEQRREMIKGMVGRLAERLKENPKDLAGWLRLGRARSVLKQHQAAADAYGKAAGLAPKNVRVLTLYTMAVLRTRKNDAKLDPGLVALMKRLYDLEPRHPLALYYLGRNAFDLGDAEAGRDYWRRLLPLIKDRPAFAARIRKRLEQADPSGRN